MKWMLFPILTVLSSQLSGQRIDPIVMLDAVTRPARIETAELVDIGLLSEPRRRLIEGALAVARDSPWLPYLAGGADPATGGFDCSGAMYFVMRKAGLNPPRSSGGQMEWLRISGRLHVVPADAVDLNHASFTDLKPGDLLFWAVNDASAKPRIHHVAMYLGTAKTDGLPLMINSTDGRTYRGRKGNGYGVYDFRVPKTGSPSKLVGYGTPPGIE
jgi:cell wall-associated NlpC family hydrolase